MLDYKECLDRLYHTITTDASGITRKEAYDKLLELIDYYHQAEEYAEKAEHTIEELSNEIDRLHEQLSNN